MLQWIVAAKEGRTRLQPPQLAASMASIPVIRTISVRKGLLTLRRGRPWFHSWVPCTRGLCSLWSGGARARVPSSPSKSIPHSSRAAEDFAAIRVQGGGSAKTPAWAAMRCGRDPRQCAPSHVVRRRRRRGWSFHISWRRHRVLQAHPRRCCRHRHSGRRITSAKSLRGCATSAFHWESSAPTVARVRRLAVCATPTCRQPVSPRRCTALTA
jgi:hypothetical protein